MGIFKSGVWSANALRECGLSAHDYFMGFSAYNSGRCVYNNGIVTITSQVVTSTWGSGVSLSSDLVRVPYGAYYIVEMDVRVPTAHTINIDINNSSPYATITSGNDNDLVAARFGTTWQIPADTWTKIQWGSKNAHANNVEKVDIFIYDGMGLVTSADTTETVWQVRNPRIYIGDSLTSHPMQIYSDRLETVDFTEM